MPTRNGRSAKASHSRVKETAGDHVREATDAVVSRVEKGIESAQQTAEAYLAQGRGAVEGMSERVVEYIQARPLQALALAAGAGALMALLMRKR
jgi:ElaB/YqjD/DUF883 family membrane-anchored ribosome-binding protein